MAVFPLHSARENLRMDRTVISRGEEEISCQKHLDDGLPVALIEHLLGALNKMV